VRFTVLASGSAGNASLVQVDGFGVLIDAGLGPRQLAERLTAVGLGWSGVDAVLLTHTHSDHWKETTLAFLQRRKVPLYCHVSHHAVLDRSTSAFAALRETNLLHDFQPGQELALAPSLRCRPFPVRHDSGGTFGFRFEGPPDLFGRATALAYAADLGSWDESVVQNLADVDLLALEFNHDVALERSSGRSPLLINRVLGDDGHLSNDQAAELVKVILARSTPGRLQHLVQLHLSEDCNRHFLARRAARLALSEGACAARVHVAHQHTPLATLRLEGTKRRNGGHPRRTTPSCGGRVDRLEPPVIQMWLPGWGEAEL
jgi:phosphoribosyl 1,2-cyclic phosphodiesterase